MGYTRRSNKARASTRKRITFIVIVTMICFGVLCYPIVATLNNNKRLADAAELYSHTMVDIPEAQRNKMLDEAHKYNDELSRRPITPPPIGQDKKDPRYKDYEKQLQSSTDYFATIVIPDQSISLPIYHGTSDEVLYKGAGHLYGTHLPVGGESTTSAIAAHTGMATASMFDNLRFMNDGELAFIHVAGETLTYKKTGHTIVAADSMDAIKVQPGKDLLQLITCTPYGVNSQRLVITLERTANPSPMPEDAFNSGNSIFHWAWWMTLISGLSLLLVLAAMIMIRKELRWYERTMLKRRQRAINYAGESTLKPAVIHRDDNPSRVDDEVRRNFCLLGKKRRKRRDTTKDPE